LRCDEKCKEEDNECPFANDERVFPMTNVDIYDPNETKEESILG
jgi:hypothetical protein